MTELKLIGITSENRRVYQIPRLFIRGRKIETLIIDPHFEENHGSYVNDELIWELVQQLNNKTFFPDPPKRPSAYQYSPLRIFNTTMKVIV